MSHFCVIYQACDPQQLYVNCVYMYKYIKENAKFRLDIVYSYNVSALFVIPLWLFKQEKL